MKPTSRGLVAFGLVALLQAMSSACGSRTPPVIVTPGPAQPAEPASPVPAPPDPAPPEPPVAAATDPEADSAACALIAEPGEPITTVALTDPVEPSRAPRPSNESERLLFRQVYETLVRLDCNGRVRPGLAESWQLDADGRTWLVTLRENARFSDGTPVTAGDVRASWVRDPNGEELRPDVSRLVQSVVALSESTLAITVRSPRADAPAALSHTDLAIARVASGSPWPLGTRSARILTAGSIAAGEKATITIARDNLPSVRFVVGRGDSRDPLDQGVDLMLTRDAAALGYAATLPEFQSVPLAWQRTHVLLAPGRSPAAVQLSEAQRQVLADDAVRGEARGARGPFWWQMVPDCDIVLSPARPSTSPAPRVVYDAGDQAARDLAERLVGLVRASGPGATAFLDVLLPDRPGRTFQRAIGLTGEALDRSRRLGADAGYLVPLDSRPVDPCRDLQALLDRAPWVDPGTIVPLVETRLRAIVRRGRAGVAMEWDGGLVIAGENAAR